MIVRKISPPKLHFFTPSPDASPRCSVLLSDCDADDEETMSAEDLAPSRPLSGANFDSSHPVGPYCPRRPTLHDVLSNSAPPPWTLSAFTAYLSQNHCLETLEFTMDAERYRKRYDEVAIQMAGMPMTPDVEESDHLRMLWHRLMEAYIMPNGPREVNLPSDVRDRLLSLPSHIRPPPPDELDAAVRIIYELMDESVLIPFLNEVSPPRVNTVYGESWNDSDENLPQRLSLDENGMPKRRPSPSALLDNATNPHLGATSRLTQSVLTQDLGRSRGRGSSSSMSSAPMIMTDDSTPSSPIDEPMTPPTTPPSSDIGGSPRNRNDTTWKKMMGKLGQKKKSSNRMGRIEDESTM